MELRKIIIYAIFVIVVIYGIYFHFLSGETVKKVPEAARVEAPVKASISAPVEELYTEQEARAEPVKLPENENKQGRNPFKRD